MLWGRDAERAVIAEVLDDARRSRSGALVLWGEAGVGKSALLDDARAHAGDMRVLAGAGVEWEAQLPFSALHQLLRPVVGRLEALPAPQADALRGALGLGQSRGADRFLVYLATLTLLADAAEDRPLLCVIDDAHWLDGASAEALLFVARRLRAEAVAVLFAAREGDVRRFHAEGIPELRLGGLSAETAAGLLDRSVRVRLSAEVRDRLFEGTAGNPLALLELPGALSEAQLSGAEPLIDPLPVSARVERAFLARARRLPDQTQRLLLVAAADDTSTLAVVLAAAQRLGLDADALDDAERAGLVRAHGVQLELRHPLVGSAIYQAAPLSQRRAVHRALAEVLDGETELDRRAWHRAEASIEPDASIGEELEQAARRAHARSAFAAASHAFERAAGLTSDTAERGRRLTAAAESAWWAGRLERTAALVERARPLADGPIQRAEIGRWQGLVEATAGIPADAYELLLAAARDVADLDPDRALDLLNLASGAAALAARDDAGVTIARELGTLAIAETPESRLIVDVLTGLGAHFRSDYPTAAARLQSALDALELRGGALAAGPELLVWAGRAALYLGDDEAVYRIHERAASLARAGGALALVAHILALVAHAELWNGRWHAAAAHATEGLELAREVGQHGLTGRLSAVLALGAAARGDEQACRSRAAESLELASSRHLQLVADVAHSALLLLDLGRGRGEEALGHAREMVTTAPPWAGADRIEAAIRAGELATARRWLEPFAAWATACAAPWALAASAHCRALLAQDPQEAMALFTAALDAHANAGRPFERARTQLAFGETLRRGRHRIEARQHLRAALDGFQALGAAAWAERARAELRASGQTARRRDPSTIDQLTAQELQIASLVAQGLTNRDVAGQLFLSPRTIDYHLRNVFRKLEITSRSELARLDLDAATP